MCASAEAPGPAVPQRNAFAVGKIATAVVAGRLANPRTLLTLTVVFAVVFVAIGFPIGRARGVKNSCQRRPFSSFARAGLPDPGERQRGQCRLRRASS
jgi:hypothetical protein